MKRLIFVFALLLLFSMSSCIPYGAGVNVGVRPYYSARPYGYNPRPYYSRPYYVAPRINVYPRYYGGGYRHYGRGGGGYRRF
jgi:hypothetical protein